MDEPTSSLSVKESENLFTLPRQAQAARHHHHLRFASHGRNFSAVRWHHGFATHLPARRHRARGGDQRRPRDPANGRAGARSGLSNTPRNIWSANSQARNSLRVGVQIFPRPANTQQHQLHLARRGDSWVRRTRRRGAQRSGGSAVPGLDPAGHREDFCARTSRCGRTPWNAALAAGIGLLPGKPQAHGPGAGDELLARTTSLAILPRPSNFGFCPPARGTRTRAGLRGPVARQDTGPFENRRHWA